MSLIDRITAHAKVGAVADLGCGPGFWLDQFVDATVLYAVDFSLKMLEQAKSRAPAQTKFIRQNLNQLSLPKPVDLAISFNALMPESHEDALATLSAMKDCLKPGGRLILLVPSFDGLLYTANARQFDAATKGIEDEALTDSLETYMRWFNNPLGYVMNGNGTVVKYWLAEEAEYAFNLVGGLKVVERFKFDRYRQVTGKTTPTDALPAWFWGWVLERDTD